MTAKFESALTLVGGLGRWQWFVLIATSFEAFFVTPNNMGLVFLGAIPDHWCKVETLERSGWDVLEARNASVPIEEREGIPSYSRCEAYDLNYTTLLNPTYIQKWNSSESAWDAARQEAKTYRCENWNFDNSVFSSTVVTDWNLFCVRRLGLSILQSSYMFGLLLGSLAFGVISDKYGRRVAVLASTTLHTSCGIAAAFAPEYYTFMILRILSGFGVAGMHTCAYVLAMEVIIPEKRALASTVYNVPHAVGHMMLGVFGFLIRDWRYLQLAIALPGLLMVSYWWILPESPRWLIGEGKATEAEEVLRKVAKCNGIPPKDIHQLKDFVETLVENQQQQKALSSNNNRGGISRFAVLFRTPQIRKRTLLILFCWFVVSMVYYGMAFVSTRMSVDPFFVVFLAGIDSLIARTFMFVPQQTLGRKNTFALCLFISGTSVLAVTIVPPELDTLRVGLALLCKFSNALAFPTAYLFTAELFPTVARNLAVGVGSTLARFGAMFAPFIVDILGAKSPVIPSAIFGTLALFASGACLLLPDTKGKQMPETVEDIERGNKATSSDGTSAEQQEMIATNTAEPKVPTDK